VRSYTNPALEQLLEKLRAGQDIVVRGWQIAQWRPDLGREPHLLLHANGSVVAVEPIRDGVSIAWRAVS
jgi:hypothetical protein